MSYARGELQHRSNSFEYSITKTTKSSFGIVAEKKEKEKREKGLLSKVPGIAITQDNEILISLKGGLPYGIIHDKNQSITKSSLRKMKIWKWRQEKKNKEKERKGCVALRSTRDALLLFLYLCFIL